MWLFGQWTVLKFCFKNKEVFFPKWKHSILFSLINILLDSLATTILISAPDSSKVHSLFFSIFFLFNVETETQLDDGHLCCCRLLSPKKWHKQSVSFEFNCIRIKTIRFGMNFMGLYFFSDSFFFSKVEKIAIFVRSSQIS